MFTFVSAPITEILLFVTVLPHVTCHFYVEKLYFPPNFLDVYYGKFLSVHPWCLLKIYEKALGRLTIRELLRETIEFVLILCAFLRWQQIYTVFNKGFLH